MNSTRRPYRKHKVKINDKYIPVKDWMRQNQNLFSNVKGVPTSEQIGKVLLKQGFKRSESITEVLYK
jgi:hypothetical protein